MCIKRFLEKKYLIFIIYFIIIYQIHHPGSKKQLEEVWEKQDEMEGENFNPRTFFAMHGIKLL